MSIIQELDIEIAEMQALAAELSEQLADTDAADKAAIAAAVRAGKALPAGKGGAVRAKIEALHAAVEAAQEQRAQAARESAMADVAPLLEQLQDLSTRRREGMEQAVNLLRQAAEVARQADPNSPAAGVILDAANDRKICGEGPRVSRDNRDSLRAQMHQIERKIRNRCSSFFSASRMDLIIRRYRK